MKCFSYSFHILAFVIWKQEIFRPVKRVYVVSESSQGIQAGMAARLSGFRIGTVTDVELKGENDVRIALDVYSDYFHFLKSDSQASIDSDSLIGDDFIKLDTGSKNAEPLKPNGVIKLIPDESMSEMVKSLRDVIVPAVNDAAELLADLNDPAREADLLDMLETIQHLGVGTSAAREAGVPRYVQMLRHVFTSMGWDESSFRGYRCSIDYPVYGSQVSMAFDPPSKPGD